MDNEAIISEIKKAETELSDITTKYICEMDDKKAQFLFREIEDIERFITDLKKYLEE